MSEAIQLQDPLYKLTIRFGSGEKITYIADQPLDAKALSPETRYVIVNAISCADPSECVETAVLNLRDVTMLKSEKVTLEQLTSRRRSAGIRSTSAPDQDDRLPKSLVRLRFI